MQLLWIGCLESDEEFLIKAQKGYDLASAQVSQKNLVYGLESVSGEKFDSINGSVLPPFPIYKDKDITFVEWSHTKDAVDVSVGYRNSKYINRINCKKAMVKAADRWVKNRYQGNELYVFIYSMRSAPMATACYVKKIVPSAKLFLIVTDLPQFMDLGQNKIKALLKKFDWISIKRMQNKFDGFILYASKMASFLHIPDGKWMLMEGSYNIADAELSLNIKKKKAIMYSGKLDTKYGIPLLIDAFRSINDPEIELWLTGGGDAEDYIKENSIQDSRIKNFGFLANREDVIKLQHEATVLINMRLPSEPASAYCFPSKLFEYMATGNPVISFKLDGIPQEYYQYLILIEEENVEAIRKAIVDAFVVAKHDDIGNRAKYFICNNKTREVQSERILNWILK